MEKYLLDLELEPNKRYTLEEIIKAWKLACKKHHPDAGGSAEDFKRVTHAKEMLTNPSYRAQHESKEQERALDLNVRMQVSVSFEQAFFGHSVNLNYNRQELDDNGMLVPQDHYEVESLLLKIPQASCNGYGKVFRGKGLKRGDKVGDVEVQVVIQPHHRFSVDQNHTVITVEKIPLDVLVKGGKVSVQTMFGVKILKIRPCTRPGERIIIRNIGFCDHIAVCDPLFPTQDDLKKEAWKGLDINWSVQDEIDEEEAKYMSDFNKMKRGIKFTSTGGF
jgi:DnaJ-class molecular chaperone